MPLPASEPVTVEFLERALAFAAYVVVKYGSVYSPWMERMERELEAARKREDPQDKARRILEGLALASGQRPTLGLTSRPAA